MRQIETKAALLCHGWDKRCQRRRMRSCRCSQLLRGPRIRGRNMLVMSVNVPMNVITARR